MRRTLDRGKSSIDAEGRPIRPLVLTIALIMDWLAQALLAVLAVLVTLASPGVGVFLLVLVVLSAALDWGCWKMTSWCLWVRLVLGAWSVWSNLGDMSIGGAVGMGTNVVACIGCAMALKNIKAGFSARIARRRTSRRDRRRSSTKKRLEDVPPPQPAGGDDFEETAPPPTPTPAPGPGPGPPAGP